MKKAVLFDMDGVLVDSEPVINAAAIKGLAEYGIQAEPDDFSPFVGAGEDRYIGGVAEKYGHAYRTDMKDRVYQIYLDLVQQQIKIFEGVNDTLDALTAKDHPLALASSADSIKVDANLKAAGIDPSVFGTLVSGEDVTLKKPAPDIYLLAASKIGVQPSDCVVVEDAINGIAAAHKAGMKCIAITTSFSKSELTAAGADLVIDSIAEIPAVIASI